MDQKKLTDTLSKKAGVLFKNPTEAAARAFTTARKACIEAGVSKRKLKSTMLAAAK